MTKPIRNTIQYSSTVGLVFLVETQVCAVACHARCVAMFNNSDEAALALRFAQLVNGDQTREHELDELIEILGETRISLGLPASTKPETTSVADAIEAILSPFSCPPCGKPCLKSTVNGTSDSVTLAPAVVRAIFLSVPPPRLENAKPAIRIPDHVVDASQFEDRTRPQRRDVRHVDEDEQSAHPAFSQEPSPIRRVRKTETPPLRRPIPKYQPNPIRRKSKSTNDDDDQPPLPKGPFSTARAKFLQNARARGEKRRSGLQRNHLSEPRTTRNDQNADGRNADFSMSDANVRAVSRAVLGKRARVGGGGSSTMRPSKEVTAPNGEELPEIPNVEPKLVEMIMNEMLDKSPGVDWDDIAGLAFAKRCVMEAIVWPMKRPDIFTGLRSPPKGLLLFGPPGTGKTLIGRAIASKSGAKFFNISASSLMSKWVGEGEKMVRALFAVARVMQPAVVFIDEIDSLLTQRTESDQEASRRVKTEFLVQMDGAGTSRDDRVLVVGATNRPQELDEAARRRLVKRLYIPLPDDDARRSMVQRLLAKSRNDCSESDFDEIVKLSKGYSGSDMYALCAEAALGPVRDLGDSIGNIEESGVRPIGVVDFVGAAKAVRASVSEKELDGYVTWNGTFGSFPIEDPGSSK